MTYFSSWEDNILVSGLLFLTGTGVQRWSCLLIGTLWLGTSGGLLLAVGQLDNHLRHGLVVSLLTSIIGTAWSLVSLLTNFMGIASFLLLTIMDITLLVVSLLTTPRYHFGDLSASPRSFSAASVMQSASCLQVLPSKSTN